MKNQTKKQWPWYMILLWAYSLLALILVFVVGGLFSDKNNLLPGVLFSPVLIFVLINGVYNLRNG